MTRQQAGRECLFGALIGDAGGATLEFPGRQLDRSVAKRALAMVGGLTGAIHGDIRLPGGAQGRGDELRDTGKSRPRPEWLPSRSQQPRLLNTLVE